VQLKTFLTSPPVLTAPQPNEDLLLYIAATDQVISTVLVVERDERVLNEVLNESKTRYPRIQKLTYAILITSRKLKHYFDGHHIIVIVGYFKRKQKNPQAHGYRCSFHLGVFQSIDFPQGT